MGAKRKPRPGRSFTAPDAASAPAEFFPRVQGGEPVPPPIVGPRVVRRRAVDDRVFLDRTARFDPWGDHLPGTGESISDRPGAD